MSRWWRWFLPGFVWTASAGVLYALFALVAYRPHRWRIIDGVITFVARHPMLGNPGGQGIGGPCVGFASEVHRERVDLVGHEYAHIWQAMMCGLVMQAVGAVVTLAGGGWHWAAFGGFAGVVLFWAVYGVGFAMGWPSARRLMRDPAMSVRAPAFLPGTERAIRTTLLHAGAKAVRLYKFDWRPGELYVVARGGDTKALRSALRGSVAAGVRWALRRTWWIAYRFMWLERHAYGVQEGILRGARPRPWGAG